MRLARSDFRILAVTLAAFALLLSWDAGGGDLALAHWFGDAGGFPARSNWWLNTVMHRGGKHLSTGVMLMLALGVRWPAGALARLTLAQRVQLLLSAFAGVFAVALVKHASHTSCPWDLAAFGGVHAYISHWVRGVWDGGPGRCFPAGHASAGFAFMGGWFALRGRAPRTAWVWLAASLAAGFAFGLAQQARGAHFMSHTLWSAWFCWCAGWAVDGAMRATRAASVRWRRRVEGSVNAALAAV